MGFKISSHAIDIQLYYALIKYIVAVLPKCSINDIFSIFSDKKTIVHDNVST